MQSDCDNGGDFYSGTEAASPLNSKLSWSKTARTASDRQDQEKCAILYSRLNQTNLLYICDFSIVSSQELNKYTTVVYQVGCIFRYLFLLSMSSVQIKLITHALFFSISHSCFMKINNRASSGNSFRVAEWVCCSQTNKGSTVSGNTRGAGSSPDSGCVALTSRRLP